MTISIVHLPQEKLPSPKERVLQFLDAMRAKVESGETPLSDLVVIAIEQTEFTEKTYALSTGLTRIEIIGHLSAMATEITMEHA